MKRLFTGVLTVLALATTGLCAADNSIGTWKANIAKSKYSPAPIPLKSYNVVREAVPGGAKVTITGERADGTPINASYTSKYDGSPCKVSGSGVPYDTMAVKQVDANTFTYVGTKAGSKYHMNFRALVSADGKTLTINGKGTGDDGAPATLTLVLEKQ